MNNKQNDKIKKFSKKNKKKKNKLVLFILLIILASIIIGLLFFLPFFNVSEIIVEGNNKYTNDEIIVASNIVYTENAFGQALFTSNKGVVSLPYIDKARVCVILPNKIKIKVVERKSMYYTFDKEKNKYYRLNESGYILEEADIRQENEIILNGITFDDEVIFGTKINDVDLSKLAIYEKIRDEYLNSSLTLPITKVSFENSLTTITLNDKLSVIFPNATNLKYNIAFLEGIIKNIGEDVSGVIDLNKENPTFSNF